MPFNLKMTNLGNINNVFYEAGQYNDAIVEEDGTADTSYADGKTYNFAFNDITQLVDKNGNPDFTGSYMKATAVKAEATDGVFSKNGDSGAMPGMDINYARYLTNRHRIGLTLGMSTCGFNYSRSAEWDVTMTTRSSLYQGEGLQGLDGFEGNAERPRVFSDDEPEVYVYYTDTPIDLGETVLGTTTADAVWDVKAALVTFRLGAVYNLTLARHFIVRMSGGLSILSVSSRFRWDETYTAPLESGTVDIEDSGLNYKHKFMIGGWADVGAHYRINRKMTLFGSMQYQTADKLEQNTSYGHHVEIDCSSLYSLRSGFSWAF